MTTHDDAPPACCRVMEGVPRDPPPYDTVPATPEQRAREERRVRDGLLLRHVDAHTHLFPLPIYQALWRWFDDNLWHIRARGTAEQTLATLHEHGAQRVVALVYAHRPGMAEGLNAWLAELARAEPSVVAVGTVLPGEPGAVDVVERAIRVHGLRGIKLHCHVQRLAIDHPAVLEVLACCERLRVPAVVHAGREPAHPAYGVDTHALCNVERTARVLEALPALELVVPHVGADEFDEYLALLGRFEHLHLDTSMSCADYFSVGPSWTALEAHADRVLYGTDFPITPYEPDRELRALARHLVSDQALHAILRGNADRLWK